jgi:hypothetical protein
MSDENDDVSDAEALLACWSYLQRRKRLGNWTQAEQRRTLQALSRTKFLMEGEDITMGGGTVNTEDDIFFTSSSCDSTDDEFAGDNEEECVIVDEKRDVTDMEFVGDEPSSSLTSPIDDAVFLDDNRPSKSFLRRSRAIKKRWQDQNYRERWYQRRWGDKQKPSKQTQREKRAEGLARALPKNFLGSPELAAMTEQEIAEAISTRLQSTQRRVQARNQTLQHRRQHLHDTRRNVIQAASNPTSDDDAPWTPTIHRDSLFTKTPQQLAHERQQRALAAKKRYQKRLENEMDKKQSAGTTTSTAEATPPPPRPYWPPKQATPRDALLRIEYALDHRQTPAADDIRLVLQPRRLAHRKDLLQRVVNETFQKHGKCVPVVVPSTDQRSGNGVDMDASGDNRDAFELEFVTHSNVESLGAFILDLLGEAKHESERDDELIELLKNYES